MERRLPEAERLAVRCDESGVVYDEIDVRVRADRFGDAPEAGWMVPVVLMQKENEFAGRLLERLVRRCDPVAPLRAVDDAKRQRAGRAFEDFAWASRLESASLKSGIPL